MVMRTVTTVVECTMLLAAISMKIKAVWLEPWYQIHCCVHLYDMNHPVYIPTPGTELCI